MREIFVLVKQHVVFDTLLSRQHDLPLSALDLDKRSICFLQEYDAETTADTSCYGNDDENPFEAYLLGDEAPCYWSD